MKIPLLATVALAVITLSAGFAQTTIPSVKDFKHPHFEAWMTSYAKAQAEAKAKKKPLLVLFTGSDWCPPCMMMEKKVLSQKAFLDYAKDNVVLFVADSPNKTQVPQDYQEQNQALATQFSIEGVPTFIIMSADGKELAKEVGAFTDKPEDFIAWVKKSAGK